MKPYEFMVYPSLQTAWISGKGILLFSGLFLVEFGACLFVVSSIFQNSWGQVAGWLIAGALGGGCHFAFLGHPFRIYKAIRRPRSAWISRGLFIISLFQLLGLIHLMLFYFSTPVPWVMLAANVMAVATVLYGGYEIADVKSIRTWNSSFLPIQLLARSFLIALAIVLVINLILGQNALHIDMKMWLLVTLFINACLFALNLVSLGFEEGKEKHALSMMFYGDLKAIFWPWVMIGGIIVPLILVVYSFTIGVMETGMAILLVVLILETVADLALRYCVIKSGYYQGLFPVKPNDFILR